MSIATTCPNCEAFFRLADTLAGKRVQCQKCKARFVVPSAGLSETQAGLPVEPLSAPVPEPSAPPPAPVAAAADEPDDEERPRAKRRAAESEDGPPRRKRRSEEDDGDTEEERPRSKRRRDDDDEEADDDRPRRKRREEEDDDQDDDRPRRRRAKKRKSSSGSNTPMILAIVGVCVVVLLGCVGVGVFAFIAMRNNPNQVGGGGDGGVVAFGADGTFRSDSALRIWDQTKNRKHFRTYTIRMEAGKTYEIDMMSNNLDAWLILLDDNNQILVQDDDGGGGLNARIVFTPQNTGNFRIEATSCFENEVGNFTLNVRRR